MLKAAMQRSARRKIKVKPFSRCRLFDLSITGGWLTFAPMKFFAFIMACIVLALSVMPCADQDSGPDGKANFHASSSSHKDNPQQDNCSPFCQCNCCAGFSVNHFITVADPLRVLTGNPTALFIQSVVRQTSASIWQPPRV